MDHSNLATASRASAIPRVSRLPTPRQVQTPSTQASKKNLENDVKSNDSAVSSRASVQKATASNLPARTSSLVARVPLPKGTGNRLTRPQEDSSKDVLLLQRLENGNSSALETAEAIHGTGEASLNVTSQPVTVVKKLRKPRPSLSDRTVETLSQVPPSPSPNRRQSGFFGGQSPMRPPPRPASAMNHARPNSRVGLAFPAVYGGDGPPSPIKRVADPPKTGSITRATTQSKRAVSSYVPRLNQPTRQDSKAALKSPRSMLQPLSPSSPPRIASIRPSQGEKPLSGSKTYTSRSSRTTPSANSLFKDPQKNFSMEQTISNGKPRQRSSVLLQSHGQINYEKSKLSKPSTQVFESPESSANSILERNTSRKPSSSIALRKTIADAKAARRAAGVTNLGSSAKPRSMAEDQLAPTLFDVDPFAFDLTESSTVNVLRKRINTARTSGRLNIATLGLGELPSEVLHMYSQDAVEASGVTWYESVDLVRLAAADNEIKELDEDAFPDVSADFEPQDDDDGPNRVFARLEAIDLHGNCLTVLPIGLRRLERLTNLNLSRNQLAKDALEIISQVQTLRELRLGMNAMQGPLSHNLCRLTALEILDIHNNAISELPCDVAKLSNLKILNVSGNVLSKLPFDAFSALPLAELDASNNKLSGTLLPSTISKVSTLRTLDVAGNALTSLSEGALDFTALQTINVSNNRLTALPSVENWKELSNFLAGFNQLSSLPEGFPYLVTLKTVDISNNNLKILDDRIGLMENLTVLRFNNNPLRERRILNLSIEDLKLELRNRIITPETTPVTEYAKGISTKIPFGSEATEKAKGWPVKAGVLDRSHTKLSTIDYDELAAVTDGPVKSLVVHHNLLKQIPPAIADLGRFLTTLDLSNNKLGSSHTFLTDSLILPNLQNLNLTSNALTSLLSLTEYLSAPNLGTLNISFNRLVDLLPLRETFPSLTKILASNNAIPNLTFEAVQGLQVLDVSSNEIGHLPPKLALLKDDLKTLMVGGNKFRVPGWGVLEKGTEEILDWLRKRIPAGEEGCEEVDSVD